MSFSKRPVFIVPLLSIVMLIVLFGLNYKAPSSKTVRNGFTTQYINNEARFRLAYPSNLNLYEFRPSGSFDQNAGVTKGYPSAMWLFGSFSSSSKYGQVGICVKKVNFEKDGCGVGMSIFYGIPVIDGKGGGCNVEYKKLKVDGQDAYGCFDTNGLSITYPKHPDGISELDIWAEYGEGFTKETAMEIVNSIKFTAK